MAFQENNKIWLDGRLLGYREAGLGLASHGLHYGTGVFEGIRCYQTVHGPAVFRLQAHLDRLYASARVYGLPIRHTGQELVEAVLDTVSANGLEACYIRPICFLGDESLGVHAEPTAHVAVLAWLWAADRDRGTESEGVRVTVSPWLKFHGRMMPTTAKACGQYINSVLAAREARARGFEEALLLNADGTIAEGAVENLFLVKDGRLFTNDETSSILPGITRASILELAGDLGIPADIRPLRVEDLRTADEAFFTGTAVEVLPIRELDGFPIGRGTLGPVTGRLQVAFHRATSGEQPSRHDWLTQVSRPIFPVLSSP